MSETTKKFYLTTPIYYVNARPHIGHAYTTIAADVIARRHRLLGDDTFFLTGTDEHGQKVQRSAAAAGIPPQQFTDEVSASFRNLWKRMGLTNDDYIRTTEARHHCGVQHLWRELEARGAIYLSSYTGQYCVSDEAFADVPVGAPCPICGRPTETITEENYFFRLSDYQLPLIDLIESGALHIQPDTARNEVLSFLRGIQTTAVQEYVAEAIKEGFDLKGAYSKKEIKNAAVVARRLMGDVRLSSKGIPYLPGALKDLSISRTTFDWGIPVPGNPKHVVYVWLDALANYITAIGYGSDDPAEQAKFARYWPADLHLVGKEITRFHCVYWPAILLAAGLPLPKSIVANGWLLFEESKMSKSRGNVVRTETILDAFGPLCPPTNSSGAPSMTESHPGMGGNVIPSPAESPNLTPPGLSGDSTGLQPGESGANNDGALAPGTTSAAPGLSGGSRLQPPESTPHVESSGAPSMTGSHPGMGGNVIPSPAESPNLTPPGLSGDSTGLQPGESGANNDGALAPGTTSAAPGLSGGSRLQPPESTPHVESSGAPSMTGSHPGMGGNVIPSPAESPNLSPPTKAQRDLFAADVLRYFLLREIPFGQDGSFSFDALITRYNADLANGYGNLVSRTLKMISESRSSSVPRGTAPSDFVSGFQPVLYDSNNLYPGPLLDFAKTYSFSLYLECVESYIAETDALLTSNAPWKLLKSTDRADQDRADTVLYTAAEAIRIITALLYPILPYATASVWQQLGLGCIEQAAHDGKLKDLKWGGLQSGTKLGPLAPIFPRADKGLAQIMTDMENPTPTPDPAAPSSIPSPEALNAVHPTVPVPTAPTDNLQPATGTSPLISIDDFAKVDLRVAQIVVAERIPKADKLLRLEVDLGPNFPRRQILAGIAEHYTPESLIGRKVVIVANLAPRKMRGLESQGMVVAASVGPDGAPVLTGFLENVELGARLK